MVHLGEGHRGPGPPLFGVKKKKKWLKRKRPAGQVAYFYLRTFAEIFLTFIFFFWKFYHVRYVKNWGVTDFVFERIWLEEHLNLSKSKKTTMAASHKILQLELWREMFSAKYGLNGPIKRI